MTSFLIDDTRPVANLYTGNQTLVFHKKGTSQPAGIFAAKVSLQMFQQNPSPIRFVRIGGPFINVFRILGDSKGIFVFDSTPKADLANHIYRVVKK